MSAHRLDLDQARRDLKSEPPEVWTRLYGAVLIDELERHRETTGRLSGQLITQSQRVGAAIKRFTRIKSELELFVRRTGWRPEEPKRPLPTTQARWRESVRCVRAILRESRLFFADLELVKRAAKVREVQGRQEDEPESQPSDPDPDTTIIH